MTHAHHKDLWLEPQPLVLASSSEIRLRILKNLSLPVEAQPSDVDERHFEQLYAKNELNDAIRLAAALAKAKSRAVSQKRSGQFVLGADQILSLGGQVLHKPLNRDQLIERLELLSGRRHTLCSAASLHRNGWEVFACYDEARVTFRHLTRSMINVYVDAAFEDQNYSVTGYQIENVGCHLIETYDGEFHTILGLPALMVLRGLRQLGAVRS